MQLPDSLNQQGLKLQLDEAPGLSHLGLTWPGFYGTEAAPRRVWCHLRVFPKLKQILKEELAQSSILLIAGK
jgi:hypothetical protein